MALPQTTTPSKAEQLSSAAQRLAAKVAEAEEVYKGAAAEYERYVALQEEVRTLAQEFDAMVQEIVRESAEAAK